MAQALFSFQYLLQASLEKVIFWIFVLHPELLTINISKILLSAIFSALSFVESFLVIRVLRWHRVSQRGRQGMTRDLLLQ